MVHQETVDEKPAPYVFDAKLHGVARIGRQRGREQRIRKARIVRERAFRGRVATVLSVSDITNDLEQLTMRQPS